MMKEEGFAFKIADRIISIQEVEGGYDYSIMDMQYKEIDGGVYDNPDIGIRQVLQDIVDDLKGNPDYNGAKGSIKVDDELILMDYDEVFEKAEMANKIGSHVYGNRFVMEFKAKTLENFRVLGEQGPEAIEETISAYVQSIIEEYELEAEIIELAIAGSRARGLENVKSDLDVVVELNTREKEDYLFNILNQYGLSIAGVKVDINPITRYQTGTLEEYLISAEKYLKRKADKMSKGYELYNAVKAGSIETIKDLIREGADVNYVFRPEEYGYTPLHMAAYYAMDEIVNLLIENGSDVNSYSLEGKTPLALAKERHNREETVSLLLSKGAVEGTTPIPDYAQVGEVFLTSDNQYWLITEDGSIQEYQKSELQNLLAVRKRFATIGREIEISFADEKQSRTSVYYGFSIPETKMQSMSDEEKRRSVADKLDIATEINTVEHPAFALALVTDEIAVYVNPGDDVLVMDLKSKAIMDDVVGVKKYHETMEGIINHGAEYDYGANLIAFCRKIHAFEKPADRKKEALLHDMADDKAAQNIMPLQIRHRKHGR